MFTFPSSGGGIVLIARPSAVTGTITNQALAYDLPSGRLDDPPYTTKASKATVTGSFVPGAADFDVVEFNTFNNLPRANFSSCLLSIGLNVSLASPKVSETVVYPIITGGFVNASLEISYQVDGSTWNRIMLIDNGDYGFLGSQDHLGLASNLATMVESTMNYTPIGNSKVATNFLTVGTISTKIRSTDFPTNLNSLKVRFSLGTCTNSTYTSASSSGSYDIWDIRATIT